MTNEERDDQALIAVKKIFAHSRKYECDCFADEIYCVLEELAQKIQKYYFNEDFSAKEKRSAQECINQIWRCYE